MCVLENNQTTPCWIINFSHPPNKCTQTQTYCTHISLVFSLPMYIFQRPFHLRNEVTSHINHQVQAQRQAYVHQCLQLHTLHFLATLSPSKQLILQRIHPYSFTNYIKFPPYSFTRIHRLTGCINKATWPWIPMRLVVGLSKQPSSSTSYIHVHTVAIFTPFRPNSLYTKQDWAIYNYVPNCD